MTREEWERVVEEQSLGLDAVQRERLERFRVEPWEARLQTSPATEGYSVWVIAERKGRVLYFDPVEWEWEWAAVDAEGRVLDPGTNGWDLKLALGAGFEG